MEFPLHNQDVFFAKCPYPDKAILVLSHIIQQMALFFASLTINYDSRLVESGESRNKAFVLALMEA